MSSRSRTLIALIAGATFGFCGALASGVLAERSSELRPAAAAARSTLSWEEASLFAEVYERIKRDYVEDVDDHQLIERAVRGMVTALDPHSAYLDSEEFEEIRLSTMGSYPGVGIEVAPGDGAVKVLHAIDGSPAQRAGLRSGDEIVKIDGVEIGADLAGATARMRGASGSTVRLTIRRPGAPGPLEFALRRAQVEVPSVLAETLEPGYGYLRVTSFTETTAEDVSHAILRLKRDNNGGLKGLVLDLRDNPGGVLEAGVGVADDFLEQGVIVTADGRTPEARFRMDATHRGDLINGAPLVVLVNGGTASASEIVAGALKDHGRALLVGRTTYGKGSVQTVMPLAHGGALKLTTSRYFTPSGASIQGKGIVPDIVERGPSETSAADYGKSGLPLAARDVDVHTGLETLKSRSALTARAAGALPGARDLVP
jgi:carboxyl-terminal processing protease